MGKDNKTSTDTESKTENKTDPTEVKTETTTTVDTTFMAPIKPIESPVVEEDVEDDFSDFAEQVDDTDTQDNPFPTGERTPLRPGKLHVERTESVVVKGYTRRTK